MSQTVTGLVPVLIEYEELQPVRALVASAFGGYQEYLFQMEGGQLRYVSTGVAPRLSLQKPGERFYWIRDGFSIGGVLPAGKLEKAELPEEWQPDQLFQNARLAGTPPAKPTPATIPVVVEETGHTPELPLARIPVATGWDFQGDPPASTSIVVPEAAEETPAPETDEETAEADGAAYAQQVVYVLLARELVDNAEPAFYLTETLDLARRQSALFARNVLLRRMPGASALIGVLSDQQLISAAEQAGLIECSTTVETVISSRLALDPDAGK